MSEPKNRRTQVEAFKMMTIITKEYVKSGKNDREFAEYLTERLGATVLQHTVKSDRQALGIKPNGTVSADTSGLNERLEAIELKWIILEEWLSKNFPAHGPAGQKGPDFS